MRKTFETISEGDMVASPDGWVPVSKVYDVHVPASMFEVTVESGAKVKASGNHLWYVETDLDRQMHSSRVKEGRRLLRQLPDEAVSSLRTLADQESGEMSLKELLDLTGGDRDLFPCLARVALSVGPVAENTVSTEDLYDGSTVGSHTVRTYSAPLLAQQVLALRGDKQDRRRWKVVVGQVVTTEEMKELARFFDVHIPDAPKM